MNLYNVIGPFVNVHSGNLALTKDQAQARETMVKHTSEGTYEIIKPVQFKRGELFGYDGIISKEFVDEVVEASNQKEVKRRKPWRS